MLLPPPRWSLLAGLLLGCAPAPSADSGSATATGTSAPPLTLPDGGEEEVRVREMANVSLVERRYRGRRTRHLYGAFVDFHQDFRNLGRCTALGDTCINVLPGEADDFIDLDPDAGPDPALTAYRHVGMAITLGPYRADYYYDPVRGVSYYQANQTSVEEVRGPVGLSYGVQWPGYTGTADLTLLEPLEVISPDPRETIQVTNGQDLILEWVPTGEAPLWLRVSSFNYERVYVVQDDGFFRLPVDSLGYGLDDVPFTLALARVQEQRVYADRDQIDLSHVSEVAWDGLYHYVATREPIEPADSCADALGAPLITQSGSFYGRLNGYEPDIDPGERGCTRFPAPTADGVLRVELQPNEILTAGYTLRLGDASLYLLEDCNRTSSCVQGVDNTLAGDEEVLQYHNASDEVRTYYLVLDGFSNLQGGPALGSFTLDLNLQQLLEPPMSDACAGATEQTPPTVAGTYYTEYLPYTNLLNPGTGGCTGSSLPGSDSITKLVVEPGQTLTATIQMPGGDPGLYLLYNCTNAFSCPAGVDARGDSTEVLTYANGSAGTETLYLVVDSKTGLRPYYLTIDLQ